MEFVGWGSRPLVEFLESIGKDTSKQLNQYDVTHIINDYVHNFSLFHPEKKKRIMCDEKLQSLLGKKSVLRNKIHDLLESHFSENHHSSEDEHFSDSEEYEDLTVTCKKQKVSNSEKKAPCQKKKTPETPLSCFAAIIPENIKLLYLKRSLVQELLKHPESFEEKLLGSYIRIKSDPNDYFQKNSHQLHPVTGVKNLPGKGDVGELLLQAPNMLKDIPICKLSDDDFSKEECEDLCQRVKDGLLKRLTVVEVEQKAQLLHEDITRHWLPRELSYLQNLIDRANEKGWRRELFEYLERRKLLQTPAELQRLLAEVPKVTADKLDHLEEDIVEPNGICHDSAKDQEEALLSNGSIAAEDEHHVGVNREDEDVIPDVNCGQKLTSFEWVEAEPIPKALDLNNVIELSDDDENPPQQQADDEQEADHKKWFYLDPHGTGRGPFSRNDLKRWKDAGYFDDEFKVWEDGEGPILLTDMLCRKF